MIDKGEIQEMIDLSISKKIKNHEIRVGIISGIIGSFILFGIVHSIWILKNNI
jgi:hypothetical protein